MTQNFAELFEESQVEEKMRPGTVVTGIVVEVGSDFVVVNAGLKSEGNIPVEQFRNNEGVVEVKVGDAVDVALEAVEDGFGETKLSREKAKRAKAWEELEKACEDNETIIGIISDKVKGGFTVDIATIRAFLPGSLVDVRPVRDTSYLEGKPIEFKVIKVDRKRNNVVVSRRAVVESENSHERDALLESLEEGVTVKGLVKNLTDYGAFIDLGGIDGLLHITDMAWRRVKHPSEVVNIGDEIDVTVLRFDKERQRVSLGLKQLGNDPWVDLASRYPENARMVGKVSNIADYGCFVELEQGVEGLVHVSEMDWTNKNVHPSKVVHLGEEVEVMVLDIDEERRRISLGMKQCKANPWDEFAATKGKGDKVVGIIKSITDFGIFVGLDGGIDGLVHLSDLSWDETGEELVRNYKKGDELEAVVLAVDAERERISLGVKQLSGDPFSDYVDANPRGTRVKGTILSVNLTEARIELAEGVEGFLRASDIAIESVDDARKFLKEGELVEALIVGQDRKNRIIGLSIKAKEIGEEAAVLDQYTSEPEPETYRTTLGDLLKEQLDSK
ncbi:MAG: 30S ribosomal protein S1 [Proteobacteria bacterium]|jgi:small subunit ribosomal protein S1|nr:30S ribosomal protein S1 [Pseudomonadota bacterium]MBT5066605.1 30S ribosomal protein S1 [Pseudomonadota bacterium]MBT6192371.1 30S ribosomal protein S1 [Pseudomonadota bacterium]MBT6465283.1 30S ribosomal protein S1 [Pseudomonadota bacterium]MBT6674059.1 30S ribosomal protein S1 [Pseudomonadota bacterium]